MLHETLKSRLTAIYGLPVDRNGECMWEVRPPPLSVNVVLSARSLAGPASAQVWVFDPQRSGSDCAKCFAVAEDSCACQIEKLLSNVQAWLAPALGRVAAAAPSAPESHAHATRACACGRAGPSALEHEIGVDMRIALEDVLNAAMSASSAAFGDVQIFDHSRGELLLVGYRGLPEDFVRALRTVRPGVDSTVCARAFRHRREEFVGDVLNDAEFEPYWGIARAVGFRAVHSMPLIDGAGGVSGVVSCLYAGSLREPEAMVSRRVAEANRVHHAALAARAG